MAHIVILGAGIGGLPAAYEIRHELGKEHRVTVINPHDHFQFVPSNPWVAVGWRRCEEICVPLRPNLKRKGIEFVKGMATRIDPEARRVETTEGPVDYDYLVIATGPRPRLRRNAEGLGPQGRQHPVVCCHVDHAVHAKDGVSRSFVGKNPGPIVVGAVQGASVLRPGLRVRLHPRHRAAQTPQDPRQGADDLRHLRALCRPSRPRRRRRHQGHARKRDARPPHQVDHQRAGEEGRVRTR
jgi:sulfide:quinone oxidoreductase